MFSHTTCDGQVAGEIILSHEIGTDETGDPMAELHIDAIFPDGAYMFAVVTDDGEQQCSPHASVCR